MVRRPTTNEAFIQRLTEITEANLKNEHFSVTDLAKQMGVSRSNLYLKVHSSTNKSVSCVIREIRLKKAIQHLKANELNVSETAYEVGFNSPAYFIKCFHDYYGYPPGETLKQEQTKGNPGTPKRRFVCCLRNYIKPVSGILLFLIIILSALFIYSSRSSKKQIEKSIAVLPFKNLSDDVDNQYFADGMMEEIVKNLSQISDIKVISVTSTYNYRNTVKSLPQIAKELKVAYVLEGSVLKENNRVKISLLFNDAELDKVIWSESYNSELEDIFELQSSISEQIAGILAAVVTPAEKERIQKRYTQNTEAYDLYLEGRFYYGLATKQGYEKSIVCYEKALAIDSSFCLAYDGLADSYSNYAWFGLYPRKDGVGKSRHYAQKALSICPDLSEAHATLGEIASYYDFDWETANKELNLAIKLNPGYWRAYSLYSQYLDIIGEREEARVQLNKALEIAPLHRLLVWLNYYYYFRDGNFDKTLDASIKCYQIENNPEAFYLRNFDVYLLQHKYEDAINEYRKMISYVSPDKTYDFLENPTSDSEDTLRKIVEFEKGRKAGPYRMAEYYAMIGDNETALDYLEKSLQVGEGWFVRFYEEPHFKHLKDSPRFMVLLKKVNLSDEQLKQARAQIN